jgi:hypothetical protein
VLKRFATHTNADGARHSRRGRPESQKGASSGRLEGKGSLWDTEACVPCIRRRLIATRAWTDTQHRTAIARRNRQIEREGFAEFQPYPAEMLVGLPSGKRVRPWLSQLPAPWPSTPPYLRLRDSAAHLEHTRAIAAQCTAAHGTCRWRGAHRTRTRCSLCSYICEPQRGRARGDGNAGRTRREAARPGPAAAAAHQVTSPGCACCTSLAAARTPSPWRRRRASPPSTLWTRRSRRCGAPVTTVSRCAAATNVTHTSARAGRHVFFRARVHVGASCRSWSLSCTPQPQPRATRF